MALVIWRSVITQLGDFSAIPYEQTGASEHQPPTRIFQLPSEGERHCEQLVRCSPLYLYPTSSLGLISNHSPSKSGPAASMRLIVFANDHVDLGGKIDGQVIEDGEIFGPA